MRMYPFGNSCWALRWSTGADGRIAHNDGFSPHLTLSGTDAGHPEAAAAVERIIEKILENQAFRTPDMGGKATTVEPGSAIVEAL